MWLKKWGGWKGKLGKMGLESGKWGVYENVDGVGDREGGEMKKNVVGELRGCVGWSERVKNMVGEGGGELRECGGGGVLEGVMKKMERNVWGEGIG